MMKKKYYAYLFMTFALTMSLSGCGRKKEENTLKSNSNKETIEVVEENNSKVNNENNYEDDENYEEEIDYSLLDQVYNKLLIANENIYNSFLKVSPSEILNNNGNNMCGSEIDNEIYNLNCLICSYIDSYNKKDYYTCNILLGYLDDYYNNSIIGRNGLYNLLIKPNLDSNHQFNLGTDKYGHTSNYSDGVYLENGSELRCVGLEDQLLIPRVGIVEECEYFSYLPTIMDNHYTYLGVDNSSNTCYIVNDVEVNLLINGLWDNLLKEAEEMYQVDASKIQIILNDDGEYVFSDDTGFILGLLSYNQKDQVRRIHIINDILNKKEFDPLLLDSYVKDLNKESSLVYSK